MVRDLRSETGRRGEALAVARLERVGHTILERNYRTREGEIDLIATRKGTLVFCEVKTLVARAARSTGPVHPLEAVRPAKRAQVRRMARAWLVEHPGRRYRDLRFDAVGVLLSPAGDLLELHHLESAF